MTYVDLRLWEIPTLWRAHGNLRWAGREGYIG
jgi:hypothetical protein